jgi:hypothetical protein
LVAAIIATFVYVNGYILAIKQGRSTVGLRFHRLLGGTSCHIAQMVGAIMLIFGHAAGLYVASVAMVIYLSFLISGAWLLLVGIHRNDVQRPDPAN